MQDQRGNLEDLLVTEHPSHVRLTSPRSLMLCRRHGILPEELYPRSFQSFVEYRGEMQEMVQRRYDHFNTRRLEKLNFLVGDRRALLEQEALDGMQLQQQQQQQQHMDAYAGVVSPSAGSPERSTILLKDTYETEQERIAARMQKEAERAQKVELLAMQRADEQEHKEMKLAWAEQRHQETLREVEGARVRNIMENAEKKVNRMMHVRGTQEALAELTEHKKLMISSKEMQRQQAMEEKKRAAEEGRSRKREAQELRAAQIKQRKEEMERARVMHLEGRLQEKGEKAVDFERVKLQQQVERQHMAENKQQAEAQAQGRMRVEDERFMSHHAHKNMVDEQNRGVYAELSGQRAQAEQLKAEAKQRRIEDAKLRAKELEETRKMQAMVKLQEKEHRQKAMQEQVRQQRLWEQNEKKIKMLDAKEAVERQKRKEKYENELRQQQVQQKMDRILSNEDAKWQAVQQQRMHLVSSRGPATPRSNPSSPRAGATRRRHSVGIKR